MFTLLTLMLNLLKPTDAKPATKHNSPASSSSRSTSTSRSSRILAVVVPVTAPFLVLEIDYPRHSSVLILSCAGDPEPGVELELRVKIPLLSAPIYLKSTFLIINATIHTALLLLATTTF